MRRRIKTASMSVRIGFGILMGGALISLLWLDHGFTPKGLPLTSVMLLLVLAAFWELLSMLRTKGVEILWFSGIVGCLAMATCPFWWEFLEFGSPPDGLQMLLIMSLILMMIFADQMFQQAPEKAILRIGGTAMAVLYLGVGMALVLRIRLDHGVPMFVVFLAAVKFTDIGAYFVGSLIGKHKLIPKLSPGKSWEGMFGGLACGAAASVLALIIMRKLAPGDTAEIPTLHTITIFKTAIFGAVVSLAAQFGDLSESLLKRSVHVKDSGAVLPEFGGVLDIIDSLVFASPIAIVVLWLMD